MSFCTQGLPGVAESTFQKAKENLLTGEKAPARADEWCEKVFFYGPHPPSSTVPPLPEGEFIFWMMDSATSPFGFAQNDSIAGGVQVSYLNKGMVQSCSCGADSTHLTLPIGTPQANRG